MTLVYLSSLKFIVTKVMDYHEFLHERFKCIQNLNYVTTMLINMLLSTQLSLKTRGDSIVRLNNVIYVFLFMNEIWN